MKRLFLLRHAKAGQQLKKFTDDHSRPLAPKGIKQCATLGSHLKERKFLPEHVLSSTSERTRQTLADVLFHADIPNTHIEYIQALYLAAPGEIEEEISHVSNAVLSLMVIGHNPGMHQFASMLAANAEANEHKQEILQHYPTGALSIFELETDDWAECTKSDVRILDFITP
jgi:phosphohistidine phosphatase